MAGTTFNVVDGVTLKRNAIAGIELSDADNGRDGNLIRNNTFAENGESSITIINHSENSVIEDNHFDANSGVAIYMLDGHGHQITGNVVSGIPTDPALGSDVGIVLEGSSDNVLLNNTMSETGDAGIVLTAGSHRNQIQGNVMCERR